MALGQGVFQPIERFDFEAYAMPDGGAFICCRRCGWKHKLTLQTLLATSAEYFFDVAREHAEWLPPIYRWLASDSLVPPCPKAQIT